MVGVAAGRRAREGLGGERERERCCGLEVPAGRAHVPHAYIAKALDDPP